MTNYKVFFDRPIENCIFYRIMGWGVEWEVLTMLDVPITDMTKAKKFIRSIDCGYYVQLAEYDQMLLDNAQWDSH
jgi:hypothetical protein